MNIIVNVNKSLGITSFGAVRTLKKLFDIKKVGHLGTLDPLATGVLPIFIGKATKLIPLFNDLDKEYRATLKLGERTDTYDKEGTVIERNNYSHLSSEEIRNCILRFKGKQKQLTPSYSAVKYQGIPAYKLARQGKKVVPKERLINIQSIDVESIKLPFVVIQVKCSKGTYIRALANDIGQMLKVGAHLEALERTAVGSYFSIGNAYALEKISLFYRQGNSAYILDPIEILDNLITIQVNSEEQKRLNHGQSVRLNEHSQENWPDQSKLAKAVNSENNLIATGNLILENKFLHFYPKKIFI